MVITEICRSVDNQGEAGGVGFGKSVERERGDGAYDILLCLAGDAVFRHAASQTDLDRLHTLIRALETLGITAYFQPKNDLEVDGKKIGSGKSGPMAERLFETYRLHVFNECCY